MIAVPPFGPIPAAPCGPQPTRGRRLPQGFVTRPCACGQPVTASRLDPAPGVREHNETAAHVRWWARARGIWQGEERP